MKENREKASFPFDVAGRELRVGEVRPRIEEYHQETSRVAERIDAEAFSKEVFMKILQHNDCHGIRIYYGRNKGEASLLLVGIDQNGNDIQRVPGGLKDMLEDDGSGVYGDGCPCPKLCSGSN